MKIEYSFNANQLSDGSIRFIALATLFLQPPEFLPNIVLIDEPELGLHPQAVDLLASMIKIASKHCQIIAATQSARLLDSFDVDDIIVADNDNDNCTILRRLNREDFVHWLEDYSLSQLWEKIFSEDNHNVPKNFYCNRRSDRNCFCEKGIVILLP